MIRCSYILFAIFLNLEHHSSHDTADRRLTAVHLRDNFLEAIKVPNNFSIIIGCILFCRMNSKFAWSPPKLLASIALLALWSAFWSLSLWIWFGGGSFFCASFCFCSFFFEPALFCFGLFDSLSGLFFFFFLHSDLLFFLCGENTRPKRNLFNAVDRMA